MKQTWCILSIDATQQFSAEGWYSPGPMRNGISSLLPFVLLLVGCGGAEPPPRTPEAPPPAATAPSEPPAPPAALEKPKQVTIDSIEVEGGGTTEADVRAAFDKIGDEYESCFSSALKNAPDAAGRMVVTILYVKGERKSVSASYTGPGNAELNKCFVETTKKAELTVDPAAERVVLVGHFDMAKAE